MEAYYSHIADFILHNDRYLPVVKESYGHWIYAFLFINVFCETGLVVTPFLPGDSLLFACGALAATADGLSLPLLTVIFLVAAVTGDACNYEIGKHFGHKMLEAHSRFIKPEYVKKAEDFYAKHGHKAIFLARFAPIVRTFAPFVAGIGSMHYRTFATYNVTGACTWVFIFLGGGFFFVKIPFIKQNFSYVTMGIVLFSLTPIIFEVIRSRRGN